MYISKSKYLSGLKCQKLIWHEYNAKDLIPPPADSTQAIFDQGHTIGKLAQSLFPDGIDLEREKFNIQVSVADTLEALSLRKPLFEAAFVFDDAYARVDILVPVENDQWDIIEVKSSAGVKDVHRHDLAIQKYILEGCGLRIRKCILMHVNSTFVKSGEIDPGTYFTLSDESAVIPDFLTDVKTNLASLQLVIAQQSSPSRDLGSYCTKPYKCALHDYCRRDLPVDNVLELFFDSKKGFTLLQNGVTEIRNIPDDFKLTSNQKKQKEVVVSGQPFVDTQRIRDFLLEIKAPYYFLDFETVNPGLPLWDGTHPFEQIPFQFSIYKMDDLESEPVHIPFLADGTDDPRPALMEVLKRELGDTGSVIAYNAGFEKSRIKECSEAFPEYEAWNEDVQSRIVDLMIPFRSFWFHHPDQHGSYSMKDVLPAMGGASYTDLNIKDGGMATRSFLKVTFGNVSAEEKVQTRKDLIEYCGQDTGGMIDVLKGLIKVSL